MYTCMHDACVYQSRALSLTATKQLRSAGLNTNHKAEPYFLHLIIIRKENPV